MNKMRNTRFQSCIFCNKEDIKNKHIRHGLCFNCMAFLVESIDIDPHDDYPVFIDFAYQSLDRLKSGENLKTIFEGVPEGFEDWLVHNAKKVGYGLTLDQNE